jgi:hypothetical protein
MPYPNHLRVVPRWFIHDHANKFCYALPIRHWLNTCFHRHGERQEGKWNGQPGFRDLVKVWVYSETSHTIYVNVSQTWCASTDASCSKQSYGMYVITSTHILKELNNMLNRSCDVLWCKSVDNYSFLHRVICQHKFKFIKITTDASRLGCYTMSSSWLLDPEEGRTAILKNICIYSCLPADIA